MHDYNWCLCNIETPPRAWGRQKNRNHHPSDHGNTPTGVGKTFKLCRLAFVIGKHPHGRGEDFRLDLNLGQLEETPPRAWGRPFSCLTTRAAARNTPTGVGKTGVLPFDQRDHEKHPHGRGEDVPRVVALAWQIETPPRAWGRRGD